MDYHDDRQLTFIPCTPYTIQVLDLAKGAMCERTVNGFNVRLYEEEPPRAASSIQIADDRWLVFGPSLVLEQRLVIQ